jgi:hypothetical protein
MCEINKSSKVQVYKQYGLLYVIENTVPVDFISTFASIA